MVTPQKAYATICNSSFMRHSPLCIPYCNTDIMKTQNWIKHDSGLTFLYILLLGEHKLHLFAKNKPGASPQVLDLTNVCLTSAFMMPGAFFYSVDFEMVSREWVPAELCPSKAHGHIN